jgi:hypothetical protein
MDTNTTFDELLSDYQTYQDDGGRSLFADWLNDEIECDQELAEPARQAWYRYCEACEDENLESHGIESWIVHGCPTGPLD